MAKSRVWSSEFTTKQAAYNVQILLCVMGIMVVVTGMYLATKWVNGDITCSFGKFQGVQGELLLDSKVVNEFPKFIKTTEQFAEEVKKRLIRSHLSRSRTIAELENMKGKMGQTFMLVATSTTADQEIGDVLNAGWKKDKWVCGPGTVHQFSDNPFCTAVIAPQPEMNLWNTLGPDGLYEARQWEKIAARRGKGWLGSWWRNSTGVVTPKYTYVLNVSG